MSEVKRYEFVYENDFGNEYPAFPRLEVDGDYVEFADLDRVTVECDALQGRLTAADERVGLLEQAVALLIKVTPRNKSSFADKRKAMEILGALKPAEAVPDFRMIGIEKMPPMEFDEP